jgi:hypothetical protein
MTVLLVCARLQIPVGVEDGPTAPSHDVVSSVILPRIVRCGSGHVPVDSQRTRAVIAKVDHAALVHERLRQNNVKIDIHYAV